MQRRLRGRDQVVSKRARCSTYPAFVPEKNCTMARVCMHPYALLPSHSSYILQLPPLSPMFHTPSIPIQHALLIPTSSPCFLAFIPSTLLHPYRHAFCACLYGLQTKAAPSIPCPPFSLGHLTCGAQGCTEKASSKPAPPHAPPPAHTAATAPLQLLLHHTSQLLLHQSGPPPLPLDMDPYQASSPPAPHHLLPAPALPALLPFLTLIVLPIKLPPLQRDPPPALPFDLMCLPLVVPSCL